MKRTATKSRGAAPAKSKGVRVGFDAEVGQLLAAVACRQGRPVEKVIEGAVWEFLARGSMVSEGQLYHCSTKWSSPPFPRPPFHIARRALGVAAGKVQVKR